MRKLVWLLVLVPAAWAGYWFLAAEGIERGLAAWLAARRAEDWQAEAAAIETQGFPFAFDTRVDDLVLADPETGLGWTAPRFVFAAKAHAPTRIEATWPERQRLLTPHEKIDVTAAEMRAALGFVPGPDLVLDAADVALREIALDSTAGWSAALGAGSLVTRRREDDPLAHDIRFSAEALRPAEFLLSALDPAGRLPEVVSRLEIASGYHCRTRNNMRGAPISEHGRGRAIDVSGFRLQNGQTLTVLAGWRAAGLSEIFREIHAKACGTFGTVLGPAADRYHQDHFHLDTRRRIAGDYCR